MFFILVKETCGLNYGYLFGYDKDTKDTQNKTYANPPTKRIGSNFTWFVQSYVGEKRGEKTIFETYLCEIRVPEAPKLITKNDKNAVSTSGDWTFEWSNPNAYNETCGLAVLFNYTFTVTKKGESEPIVSINTTATNGTVHLDNGEYSWSVTMFDNIRTSKTSTSTISFCNPEPIP